jgi:hypothetical protein
VGFNTRITIVCVLGLIGLGLPFLRLQPSVSARPATFSLAPPPRSAAEAALLQAQAFRTRAKLEVSEQRTGWEAWDPQGTDGIDADAWRLQQLALDLDGNLRQAELWAERAARQAHTRAEAYRAAELKVLLDHEMGHHEAEIREAQRLTALAPGSVRAEMVLRRAEGCYRRLSLIQRWVRVLRG